MATQRISKIRANKCAAVVAKYAKQEAKSHGKSAKKSIKAAAKKGFKKLKKLFGR